MTRHSNPSAARHDDDRGAILVMFALLVTLLVGSAAIVIDIGALYSERRQLQNGADAAAFAVVTGCVASSNCVGYAATAQTYADLNARDGTSSVTEVCGVAPNMPTCTNPPTLPSGVRNWVRVSTQTRTTSGGNEVPFVLGPILDATQTGQTMKAKTVVGYGPLGSRTPTAVTLSRCTFQSSWIGANGSLNFPTTNVKIPIAVNDREVASLAPDQKCTINGREVPNGFDFLSSPLKDCFSAPISVVNGITTAPGGSEGNEASCKNRLDTFVTSGQPAIFPVYTGRTGIGTSASYTLAGFAAFQICGFRIAGGGTNACSGSVCDGKANEYRICGRYQPRAVSDGEFALGTTEDFGVRLVKAIG